MLLELFYKHLSYFIESYWKVGLCSMCDISIDS